MPRYTDHTLEELKAQAAERERRSTLSLFELMLEDDDYRAEHEKRLQAHADRLNIEPEEYQEYEYNTLLGSALHGLGFAPPQQDKYEDLSIFDPRYWETHTEYAYDKSGNLINPMWYETHDPDRYSKWLEQKRRNSK